MFLPQHRSPRLKKDYIWTEEDSIIIISLSSLDLYKIIISSKLTTIKEFIEKDNIKILRLLKDKDWALNLEPITLENPKIETNKDNNNVMVTTECVT